MNETVVPKEQLVAKMEELIRNLEAPFSIAAVDIDNFADINNTYGSDIGNEIINKLTSIFSRNLSSIDMLSRQGDEFDLLLVNKGAERSFMEMEEIRRYLSDNTFTFETNTGKADIYITFSCGIASCPRDSKNVVELFRVADSALFRAKKLGKNKVCLSEAESMVLKSSYLTKRRLTDLRAWQKKPKEPKLF